MRKLIALIPTFGKSKEQMKKDVVEALRKKGLFKDAKLPKSNH